MMPWCKWLGFTSWLLTAHRLCSPHQGTTNIPGYGRRPVLMKIVQLIIGLSQPPNQLPDSISGSTQHYCNNAPIPASTPTQFPTHIGGQPITETSSLGHAIGPTALSQQLSDSLPNIHPFFTSHHTGTGHMLQPGSALPSMSDILNADCGFPDWIPSADEPPNNP